MEKRVFYNPKIKDKVTVLKSSAETNHEYVLLEIELDVKGGNGLHYHTTFTEEFIPIEGDLGVQVGKEVQVIKKGQTAQVGLKVKQRFFNPGDKPIRFHVKLAPGHEGFVKGVAILYGLAADGLTNEEGVPKNMSNLALLLDLCETYPTGLYRIFTPVFRRMAKNARKKGKLDQLLERYW
jgi:mannose-6-phosphate isomerase-like protein (cupin superfamily)